MKRTLLFLSIAFTINMCYAQDVNGKHYVKYADPNEQGFAAATSPNKDTLWLSEDPTAKLIASLWERPENSADRPVIIFTSTVAILNMRKNPRYAK